MSGISMLQWMHLTRIVTQPGSIKKVAAAALFKFKTPAFDKEECKAYLKSISDDLTEVFAFQERFNP